MKASKSSIKTFAAVRRFLRRLAAEERGATAILSGVALTAVVGFAGVGTEVGQWYVTKRSMQGAVDAAAFSAAAAAGHQGSPTAEGQAVAAQFGFVNGVKGVTVAINNPPTQGSQVGNSSAYEAIITAPQTRLFSKVLLSSSVTIGARAVASAGLTGDGCVLALDSSAAIGVTANGTDNLNLAGCSLYSNATGSDSLLENGNVKLTADKVSLAGSDTLNGTSSITATGGVQTNQSPASDPYSSVPVPGEIGVPVRTVPPGNSPTLQPGVYRNGAFKLNGTGTATMQPGTYIIDGGAFTINGNWTVNGAGGVTIVFTNGSGGGWPSVAINGSPTLNLTAPTTGTYQGILFFYDRTAPASTITFNGSSKANLTGALYFPSQNVTYNGTGTASCTQLIAQTITFNGNVGFGGNCTGDGTSPIGLTQTTLVE